MNDRWTLRFTPAAAFAVAPLVLAMVLAAAAPAAGAEISSIAPEKLEEMLGAPDLIVVDVRSDGQRESSGKKIRSAITVQSNQLESWSKDMPPGGRIVLYCDWPNEETSASVARRMMNRGFKKVFVLKGGWDAWEKGDHPMETIWILESFSTFESPRRESGPAPPRPKWRRFPMKGGAMARLGDGLDTNDPFPEMEFQTYQGETIRLPEFFGDNFGVVQFVRGNWWPFCDQQLADFHAHYESMKAENIGLVIGSVEPSEKVKETIDKLGIHRIPFATGVDPAEISRRYGAYFDEEKGFLHATGFLLLPGGKVLAAVYSSGSIGRLMARDVINLVRFIKSERKKSFHLVGALLEVR